MAYRKNMLKVLLGAAFLGITDAAHALQCEDPDVRVDAQDDRLAERICEIVARTKPALKACGLTQWQPLDILVDDGPGFQRMMGHYNPRHDRIKLPSPAHLIELIAEDSVYRALPIEDLYSSIIVHELTHAFFAETRCGRETCIGGHEYIAYALQIDSLPAQSRQTLLDAYPAKGPVDLSSFNETYLMLSPERFAVNAWRHFSAPENGCEFVRGIVEGSVQFPWAFE